jgi:hypothetical protein
MKRAVLLGVLAGLFALPPFATAVEYRLRVANLRDSAYFHYADRDGGNRDTPFSLKRLEGALDQRAVPLGSFVPARVLEPADPDLARSFQAAQVHPLGAVVLDQQWSEVRWEGQPRERVVWALRGEGIHHQAVIGVALPGGANGDFRHYTPYDVGLKAVPLRVNGLSLAVIDAWHGRENFWPRLAAPNLDLHEGIAALIGRNPNTVYADAVFIVIDPLPTPTTYDVAIGWRQRTRGNFNPFFDGAAGGSDPAPIR